MRIWLTGIRGRLFLLISIPLIALLAVGSIGIYASESANSDLNLIGRQRMPKSILVGHLRMNNHSIMRFLLQTTFDKLDDPKRADHLEAAQKRIQQFSTDLASIDKFKHTEIFKRDFAPVIENAKLYDLAIQKAVSLLKKNTTQANQEAILIIEKDVTPISEDLVKKLECLEKDAVTTSDQIVDDSGKRSSLFFYLILVTSALSILSTAAFGFFTARRLANTLAQITLDLSESGQQLASTTSGIASSSDKLSEASTEQASSLQQTAASLQEISSMVSKSAASAASAQGTSSDSLQKSEEGKSAVEQMLAAMDEIGQSNRDVIQQVEQSNREFGEIVKVIHEIGNKTKVINEIVFQTKLLSFNASVEAARAGEHGKGFAVVAEEVGNLAQMSGNAAKDITQMLDSSTAKVEKIVSDTKAQVAGLIEQSKLKLETGVSSANHCEKVLNEIVEGVSKVAGLAMEISSATSEQSKGVDEITKAMSQLDSTTHQNTTMSLDAARSAQVLSKQADVLKLSIDQLQSIVDGSGGPAQHKMAS